MLRTAMLILIASTLTLLTGCFEIEELIKLNKDGSGTYTMKVDMSEAGALLASMGGGDEEGGMMGSLDSTIQETAKQLRAAEGISNVRTSSENYIMTIIYDFDKVENISAAQADMESSTPAMLPTGSGDSSYELDVKKRIFKRVVPDMGDLLGDMEGDDEMAQGMEMAKMMMKDATYRTTYIFPGKVKSVSNTDAVIKDSKTVELEVNFLDLLEQRAQLGNEVKFKKK